MERDPIIEELHAIREAFAAAHNHDLVAMCETLRRHQRESGREVVSFAPRLLSTHAPRPAEDSAAVEQANERSGRGSSPVARSGAGG